MNQSPPQPHWLEAYRANFGKDFLASIVVFLVALPLCMGIAIASGVPPALGLITGIVGGLVVGFIAGSPLQVSGPAAGLAVIIWELVQTHGIGMLGVIVLLAGLIQLTAGLLKLGQWFRAVSPAVIYGMLAGIGVLIFGAQFHVMVDDKPKGSGIANLLSIPEAVYKGIFPLDGSTHHMAAAIGLLTIVTIIAWTKLAPARLKAIPAPLVAVVVATVVAALFKLPINYVSVPDNLWSVVQWPTLEGLSRMFEPAILGAAMALALVASAETLLCATAVDQMHSGPRTKYDKELAAQGVGNAICGLLGALPMTGVIVRSTANVQAGGQTRMSAILHGGWLLAFVLAMPFVLKMIPISSLAALLVFTGYKLVNPAIVKKLASFGNGEVAIYGVTLAAIVATNLLEGVLIGLALSAAKLLLGFARLEIEQMPDPEHKRVHVQLRGAATFLRLPALAATLDRLNPDTEVQVHVQELSYIDHACLDLLTNWEKQFAAVGGVAVVDWNELTGKYHRKRAAEAQQPATEKAAIA